MKRYLALLLSLAFCFALLAGCGSAPAPTDAPATEAPPAEAPEQPEGPPPDEGPADEPPADLDPAVGYDLPLFDEEIEFSMWVSFSDIGQGFMPNGYSDNWGYKQAAELTNVTMEMIQVSSEMNTEQFNMMIASNEYPDIITNVAMLWRGSYDNAIEEEIFIDLKEMTHEYMPYYMLAYDNLSDAVKRDLYTDAGYMPRLISINANPDGATEGGFIRTDLLEKIGKDVPKTYDQVTEVLKAFKTELNLGEPLMLPSGITPNNNAFCAGFGVNGGFSTFPMTAEPYYVVDGEIKYGIVEPGFKEYMELLSSYYAEGLVHSDFMSKNTNPMSPEYMGYIASDDVGMCFGETGMLANYYDLASNPDYDLTPMEPITKNEGETIHFGTYKSEISGRVAGISITTNIYNRDNGIENLGKYLDFFFTEAGALTSAMGTEATEENNFEGSYIFDDEGKLQYSDYFRSLDVPDMSKTTLCVYSVMPMLVPETPKTYTMDLQYKCSDVWDTRADADYRTPDGMSMTDEENAEYNNIYPDIQTMVQENLLKFLTGDRPMSEWDSFTDKLWELGMQDCIDLKQSAYDRYLTRSV